MSGVRVTGDTVRVRARIEGVVQGVGFRPFVHRLAMQLRLAGFVRNDAHGVELEVEGDSHAVELFFERLMAEAPPLAEIETITRDQLTARGRRGFTILASVGEGADTQVAADVATCGACLAELLDPDDRRHRYPFINCTDCGPRFTIVERVPYDRPNTTMAGFEMCVRCAAEYEDPNDRRFHAQPNACPDCGPRVRLIGADGEPLATTAEALRDGLIIAVKGIGGYHLACRADAQDAVVELRRRKQRDQRPFAVMVADLDAARQLVSLGDEERALLESAARPIVLARRLSGAAVADGVAPGLAELGVMLAYSPLHHLLLRDVGVPCVMTSGNVSDEPIAYRDEDAFERLTPIADLILTHDRPIATRVDDSVARAVDVGARPRPVVLRRSRGIAPHALRLPVGTRRSLLAVGAQQKNTFCLAAGDHAWVSEHIGDLDTLAQRESFVSAIEHLDRLFSIRPELVVHDMHPDYASTMYALGSGLATLGVQHHHAHLAACIAEHGRDERAVGAIYDGTGLGSDGTIWGGELLVGGLAEFERAGHLWPVRLPGGEQAVRQPWRMACSWLAASIDGEPQLPRSLRERVEPGAWRAVVSMIASGVGAPITSSAGRLFDAVAALCGLRTEVSYEGQAAIELEACARNAAAVRDCYALPFADGRLDARVTVRELLTDLDGGAPTERVAARFHNGVARGTATACAQLAAAAGTGTVVLSGGVFQNRMLLERTAAELLRLGLEPLVPQRLPANDGGIAFGQAAIAAASAA